MVVCINCINIFWKILMIIILRIICLENAPVLRLLNRKNNNVKTRESVRI